MNRRDFLRNSAGVAALGVGARTASAFVGEPAASQLTPWQPGFLDIHHINTGRGNSALAIFPDGTSLLIDAGATVGDGPGMNALRPNGSRRPGEWIARYVQRQLKPTASTGLDYALVTHLHNDHIGDPNASNAVAREGKYKLTGISDVAEAIPIAKLMDRGFPDYDFPARISDAPGLNYIQFVRSRQANGQAVERVQPGSATQIVQLRDGHKSPDFSARILAGNGQVWTGEGAHAIPHFSAASNPTPPENNCSIALRLSYGKFSYFTGGDLNCDTHYGQHPWLDIESLAARAAAPVSVSTCNHHGYFDANGPEMVRALRPRIWILQSWHATHPALSVLANLYSPLLYPGERDVFCLGLNPATSLATGRFSDGFKSSQGHVLVRVEPGGAHYSLLVLEDRDETDRVNGIFGPYPA